jgi:hypothetical protein
MSGIRRLNVGVVFLAGLMAGAVLVAAVSEIAWSKGEEEATPAAAGSGNWAIAPLGDSRNYCWVISPQGKLYTVYADKRMTNIEVKGVLDLTKEGGR